MKTITHAVTFKWGYYGKPETRFFGSVERAREVAKALRRRPGYRVTVKPYTSTP